MTGEVVMHILIVDDDQDIRKMLQLGLTLMGHNVQTAENGVLALERVDQEEFDLLLVDVFMPEMDGFELLGELRSREFDVPIIALSGGGNGMSGNFYLKIAQKFGVFCTLQKPFSLTELGMAIDACLVKNAQNQERRVSSGVS